MLRHTYLSVCALCSRGSAAGRIQGIALFSVPSSYLLSQSPQGCRIRRCTTGPRRKQLLWPNWEWTYQQNQQTYECDLEPTSQSLTSSDGILLPPPPESPQHEYQHRPALADSPERLPGDEVPDAGVGRCALLESEKLRYDNAKHG